jgi:hypothetical protein
MTHNALDNFLAFLNASPTPFHAVQQMQQSCSPPDLSRCMKVMLANSSGQTLCGDAQ